MQKERRYFERIASRSQPVLFPIHQYVPIPYIAQRASRDTFKDRDAFPAVDFTEDSLCAHPDIFTITQGSATESLHPLLSDSQSDERMPVISPDNVHQIPFGRKPQNEIPEYTASEGVNVKSDPRKNLTAPGEMPQSENRYQATVEPARDSGLSGIRTESVQVQEIRTGRDNTGMRIKKVLVPLQQGPQKPHPSDGLSDGISKQAEIGNPVSERSGHERHRITLSGTSDAKNPMLPHRTSVLTRLSPAETTILPERQHPAAERSEQPLILHTERQRENHIPPIKPAPLSAKTPPVTDPATLKSRLDTGKPVSPVILPHAIKPEQKPIPGRAPGPQRPGPAVPSVVIRKMDIHVSEKPAPPVRYPIPVVETERTGYLEQGNLWNFDLK